MSSRHKSSATCPEASPLGRAYSLFRHPDQQRVFGWWSPLYRDFSGQARASWAQPEDSWPTPNSQRASPTLSSRSCVVSTSGSVVHLEHDGHRGCSAFVATQTVTLPQCHSFPYHTTACGKSLNCVSMNPFLNSQVCGVICLSIYANTIPYFLFLVTALVYISVFYVIPYHLKQNVRTLQQLCPSSSPSSVLPSSRTSLSRIINPTIHFYSCFKQWIIF